MSITGTSQPTKVGVPIADLIAGMNGAFGVVAALHERTRTGRGRVVRTSLLAGMVGVHAFQGTKWTVAGEVPGPLRRPPSVDRAVRHVRDRYGADPDRLWLGGAVAGLVHGAGVGPGRGRLRHQPRAGRQPRRADREAGGALRLRATPSTGWRCSPTPACRPARCARWTTSTPGTRRCRRASSCRVDHPTLGAVDLPGPPLRFDDNPFSGGRSSTSLRRRSASTTSRSGSGWTAEPRSGGRRAATDVHSSCEGGGRSATVIPVERRLASHRSTVERRLPAHATRWRSRSVSPGRRWRRPGRRRRGPGGPPRPTRTPPGRR